MQAIPGGFFASGSNRRRENRRDRSSRVSINAPNDPKRSRRFRTPRLLRNSWTIFTAIVPGCTHAGCFGCLDNPMRDVHNQAY
ncbi:hypothetical protein Rcae01_00968 [Novipirellula caenicola]|uniref:Uncharacterized protein n=1 Tax=Novipirellula caenicola TaxID=1536901 RepID=A0ABP9VPZ6_9BACT